MFAKGLLCSCITAHVLYSTFNNHLFSILYIQSFMDQCLGLHNVVLNDATLYGRLKIAPANNSQVRHSRGKKIGIVLPEKEVP